MQSKQINKESILAQVNIVEQNINRFRLLLESDLMHGEVPLYCVLKAKLQLQNIEIELTTENNKLISE